MKFIWTVPLPVVAASGWQGNHGRVGSRAQADVLDRYPGKLQSVPQTFGAPNIWSQ